MSNSEDLRYDPLYRVIDDIEEFNSVEGKFKWMYDRLKKIDNLGVIPRIYEMARYPKYEHTVGTLHQVSNLLQIVDEETIPKKYRGAFKVAAMFLHVGHMPFTVTTERALLLSSNLGDRSSNNEVRTYLENKIRNALDSTSIEHEEKEELLKKIIHLERPELLYRALSADKILENRDKILDIGLISEGKIEIVVDNLINEGSDGYKYLNIANKADYVQRDALYLGTAKIDLSPKHLYSGISKYQPSFGVDEETLIDINLHYIRERFYKSDRSIWFSRILEKVIASLIISENFETEYVEEYGSREFERLICENRKKDNSHAKLPPTWCDRANEILNNEYSFSKIFEVGEGSSPIQMESELDVIDVEYEMIGKKPSKRGILSYPFEEGFLISLDYVGEGRSSEEKDFMGYSFKVFKEDTSYEIGSLVSILENVNPYLSFSGVGEARKGIGTLLSKTGHTRFETEFGLSKGVTEAISRAVERIDRTKSSLFAEFRGLSSFESVWRAWENQVWLMIDGALMKDPESSMEGNLHSNGFAKGLLSLPASLLQCADPRRFLQDVKDKLRDMIKGEEEGLDEGEIFEAVCFLDRIISDEAKFQFFMNGLYEIDPESPKDKRDIREHDILEVRKYRNKKPEILIYACTISDSYKSKDRDDLRILAENIHDNVATDVSVSTRHMIPNDKDNDDWKPSIENAGTNF